MPLPACKLLLRDRAIRMTDVRWSKSANCENSRHIWPHMNLTRSRNLLEFTRSEVSLLISVLTGHCLIGDYAKKLQFKFNDYCRSCNDVEERETIKHLLCDCPALCVRRRSILGAYAFTSTSELSNISLRRLLRFLKQSGWFNGRD